MNLQHHFLIAMPSLLEPQFKCSVIYICEHNKDGAMGLVVNRPIDKMTLEGILRKLNIQPTPRDPAIDLSRPVFSGGPLAGDRGFILHTPQNGFASSIQLSDDIMLTTSKDLLLTLGTALTPPEILLTLGYAGWQRGQLEKEVRNNAWLTIDADAKILFHTPTAMRWRAAASKLGIDIRNISLQAGNG